MQKKAHIWQITGFFFTMVLGTALHFFYHWSNENNFIAWISPVNESTWEHLKLLFTPFSFFTLIEYFSYGKYRTDFFLLKCKSVLLGMVSIIVLFYTYSGILGTHFLFLDILTFFISVFLSYSFCAKQLNKEDPFYKLNGLAGIVIFLFLIFLFILFTEKPPHINLFFDPAAQTYGRE